MKAIVIDGYGGLDRLRLDERPDPVPGPGEVQINVRAGLGQSGQLEGPQGGAAAVLVAAIPVHPRR